MAELCAKRSIDSAPAHHHIIVRLWVQRVAAVWCIAGQSSACGDARHHNSARAYLLRNLCVNSAITTRWNKCRPSTSLFCSCVQWHCCVAVLRVYSSLHCRVRCAAAHTDATAFAVAASMRAITSSVSLGRSAIAAMFSLILR